MENFSKLVEKGVEFDMEDSKDFTDPEVLASPWVLPFDELRPLMLPIGEHIFKRITRPGQGEREPVPDKARVSVRYSAFWEGEGLPFDSSLKRGGNKFEFETGKGMVLEGLEAAVRTMRPYEQAEFIVSYKLLSHGLPKPKAVDGLFKVEVIDYTMVGPKEDGFKFSLVYPKAQKMYLHGKTCVERSRLHCAVDEFEGAIDKLYLCCLENDEEQRLQTALLLKLSHNLMIVLNKLGKFRRVCGVMKDVRRLTANKPSCKALFQEARALTALGEYERARKVLKQANEKEPENKEIYEEIVLLDQRIAKLKKANRDLWSRAQGRPKAQPKEPSRDPEKEAKEKQFKLDMEEMVKKFENTKLSSIDLCCRLFSDWELAVFYDIITERNMTLTFWTTDVDLFTVAKKEGESPSKESPNVPNNEGPED